MGESQNKFKSFLNNVWQTLKLTGKWAYQLRSLVMSIPVFVCAVVLAIRNARLLPDMVGINILASGGYQWTVSRTAAVLYPLGTTVICLVMAFCSKKPLFPWLISLLSLVLPIVLWVVNSFAA